MNAIYRSLGTTKQNVHQRLNRYLAYQEERAQLKVIMDQLREDHPGMGAKYMFDKLKPDTMGRDKFIDLYTASGFKLKQKKNFRRTTDSSGVIRFPNLIQGRELTGVNQVWVSDITYFDINGQFYYLTFILDQYSRKVVGYAAGKTLRTIDTTIPALKMALKNNSPMEKPILHSDGGGQYYSKAFLTLACNTVISSMCVSVYENPHAERINGTIKNYYLIPWSPQNFQQLTKLLTKAIYNYNYHKPHKALSKLAPVEFEKSIELQSTQMTTY